ncbi:hypothetical protein N7513_010603 [Penicillium frequentans]|nr:hypothetical protein N7513_010603 [Penicillium glabrum]
MTDVTEAKTAAMTEIVPPEREAVPPERVLGTYIFQRHGDRTVKSRASVTLTRQGEGEQYMAGLYFRDPYLSSESKYRIERLNTDVSLKQVVTKSPKHDVMIDSGNMFLRGLYPPTTHPRDMSSESMGDLDNPWQIPDYFVWTRGKYLLKPTTSEEDALVSFPM